jgi:hypothetical protein
MIGDDHRADTRRRDIAMLLMGMIALASGRRNWKFEHMSQSLERPACMAHRTGVANCWRGWAANSDQDSKTITLLEVIKTLTGLPRNINDRPLHRRKTLRVME